MALKKQIKGYAGYQITSEGEVWSVWKAQGSSRVEGPWHKLRSFLRSGYPAITMSDGVKQRSFSIHRLMAQTFIPNPENKPFVCHANGNPLDNRLENLYWGTALENNLDRIKHGTMPMGETHPHAKLNESAVRFIKKALLLGVSQRRIARVVGVHQTTINLISVGKNWKTLACGWEKYFIKK